MPGTVVFKPIQAKLLQDNHLFGRMNCYCVVQIADQEVQGKVCKSGGKNPHWEDAIVVKRGYERYCNLKIMDKEFLKSDPTVGNVEIDLSEIEQNKRLTKWYKVALNNQPAGEILIESIFASDNSGTFKQTAYQQSYALPPSPMTHAQNHYASVLYSPAKQHMMSQQRQITQMPATYVPGALSYVPQITHAHISHHLTSDEYHKLHSRQDARYQPTTSVIGNVEAPPSWPGYEVNQVSSEEHNSQSNSTAGGTPDNQSRKVSTDSAALPTGLNYIPNLGGVRYVPEGSGYRPAYPGSGYEQSASSSKGKVPTSSGSQVLVDQAQTQAKQRLRAGSAALYAEPTPAQGRESRKLSANIELGGGVGVGSLGLGTGAGTQVAGH